MRRALIHLCLVLVFLGLPLVSDVQSQEPPTPPGDGIWDVAWSPDGTQLATANPNGRVYLRNQAGEIVQPLTVHEYRVVVVEWSPDGRFIASGGWDDIIIIFDLQETFIQEIFAFYGGGVYELSWQPTGELLLAGGFDTFDAWDTATWRRITNSPGVSLTDIAWSPDGTQFAVAGTPTYLGVVTIQDGRINARRIEGHTELPNSIDWSFDGTMLLSAGERDGSVRLWDAATGTQIRVLLQTDEVMTDAVFVAPDASQVAAITEQGHIYIINTETGEIEQTLTREARLWALDWNPQANLLAVGGLNTNVPGAGTEALDVMATGFLEILPLTSGK
jgi:WD40 repeat protein